MGQPAVAEQQPRRSELGCDQFLEPHRGRRGAAGEFGHEGDARILHALPQGRCLGSLHRQGHGRIDGLAVVAGGQDRRRAIPLLAQVEDGVDVRAGHEGPEAVHRRGPHLVGRPTSPVGHLLADSADLEPVGQGPQGRQVPVFPLLAEADDPDAELHARSPVSSGSAAASSPSRRSPLSAMSLRHQPPGQRISLTAV